MPQFQEVEYKYLVDETFDRKSLDLALKSLKPTEVYQVQVTDTYFYFPDRPNFVYRHRSDDRSQDFCVKSLEKDPVVRTEINMKMTIDKGSQLSSVVALLQTLGPFQQGSLDKDVSVYIFEDCEVVYYEASTDKRRLCCVELEAVGAESLQDAFNVLNSYVDKLNLSGLSREQQSLFEMLIKPQLVEQV